MKRWKIKKTDILLAFLAIGSVVFFIYAVLPLVSASKSDVAKVTEPVSSSHAATTPAALPRIEVSDVYSDLNKERVKAGLGALAVSATLEKSACMKVDDMIAKDYWAHVAPDGTQPWHWFTQAGYSYLNAGENQGYGFASSESLVWGWMNSPKHRENVLGNYTEMGVCVKSSDKYQGARNNVIVNHFATPR